MRRVQSEPFSSDVFKDADAILPLLLVLALDILRLHERLGGGEGDSGHVLRQDYLIRYAYFDEMLFRTICFYQ